MTALEVVKVSPLMARTTGRPEVTIGLIDGPVAIGHPDLESESIRELPAVNGGSCAVSSSTACQHGTFVAGVVAAQKGAPTPPARPRCTFLVRPRFLWAQSWNMTMTIAHPHRLR